MQSEFTFLLSASGFSVGTRWGNSGSRPCTCLAQPHTCRAPDGLVPEIWLCCSGFAFFKTWCHACTRVCVCFFFSLLNNEKREEDEEEEVRSFAKSLYLFYFQPLSLSTRSSRGIEFIKPGSPSNASKRYTYSNHFRKHLQSMGLTGGQVDAQVSHNAPLYYSPLSPFYSEQVYRRHDHAFQTGLNVSILFAKTCGFIRKMVTTCIAMRRHRFDWKTCQRFRVQILRYWKLEPGLDIHISAYWI